MAENGGLGFDKERELAKKLLQIIFDEYGSEGVSVDDVELITQEMVGEMKATPMVLNT